MTSLSFTENVTSLLSPLTKVLDITAKEVLTLCPSPDNTRGLCTRWEISLQVALNTAWPEFEKKQNSLLWVRVYFILFIRTYKSKLWSMFKNKVSKISCLYFVTENIKWTDKIKQLHTFFKASVARVEGSQSYVRWPVSSLPRWQVLWGGVSIAWVISRSPKCLLSDKHVPSHG